VDQWAAIFLVVTGILVLIPVVMGGRIAIGILTAWRDHRAEMAREVTCQVPGLGPFTSTDGSLWFGEVQELQITLNTTGEPPTAAEAALVLELLGDLPRLVELGRAYLMVHEDSGWLEEGAERFEPYGIEPEDRSTFVLEFVHPADDDGVYRVDFESGVPVNAGRDD
jgi:hypothetical protein